MRMGMFNITRFACQTNPRRNSAPVSKPLIADSITAWCKAATASVLALLLAVVAAHQLLNHSESIFAAARPQASAAETLRKYVELRLHNADWKDYSRLVTWPDEPGWDCNWVVDKYSVGTERKRGAITAVPITYQRVGLFCYDFEFTSEPNAVTVNYELVKRTDGWKINSPLPDYPDISAQVLLDLLTSKASSASEPSARQTQFRATARKIAEALAARPVRNAPARR